MELFCLYGYYHKALTDFRINFMQIMHFHSKLTIDSINSMTLPTLYIKNRNV